MGNQKFKLTDMIPNAWFYKPKDGNNTTKSSKIQSNKPRRDHLPPPPPQTTNNPPQVSSLEPQCQYRKSYHITRELIHPPQELDFSPPRKSKSSSKSRKSSRRTSSYSSCSCKSTTTFQSSRSKSNSPSSPPLFEDTLLKTEHKTEDFDIVIDVDKNSFFNDINTFNFKLPPIITKHGVKPRNNSKEEKVFTPISKEQRISPSLRKFSENRGVRLKVNSPRIMGMKQGQNGNSGRKSTSSKKRRSISESFAVVKSSFDPHRDFKESMVEMIVQNNLRASKDLEDLLACYLSLNSDEYHGVIIKVFKQIWFDLRHQK
ncbi:Transcription repressor OFP3 [Bienertia sinuspersici]